MTCAFCKRNAELHEMMVDIYSGGKVCETGMEPSRRREVSRLRGAAGDAVQALILFLEQIGSPTCPNCASAHKFDSSAFK